MVAVPEWFRFRKPKQALLEAVPVNRRMKTYSAQSGYVYQYAFAGQRPCVHGGSPGIEYAFDVCHDRKSVQRVWVFVADAALAPWVETNGRTLTGSERYGVAKLALRGAFDDRPPARIHERIEPDDAGVRAILEELDV